MTTGITARGRKRATESKPMLLGCRAVLARQSLRDQYKDHARLGTPFAWARR
jgi:hypothetical protein